MSYLLILSAGTPLTTQDWAMGSEWQVVWGVRGHHRCSLGALENKLSANVPCSSRGNGRLPFSKATCTNRMGGWCSAKQPAQTTWEAGVQQNNLHKQLNGRLVFSKATCTNRMGVWCSAKQPAQTTEREAGVQQSNLHKQNGSLVFSKATCTNRMGVWCSAKQPAQTEWEAGVQ